MKSWESILGWYDWEVTYREIVNKYDGGLLVEVGNFLGRSLCSLGQMVKESGKPFQVVGVDTCRGSGIENGRDNHVEVVHKGSGTFAGSLHRNVIECGLQDVITLIVGDSERAANLIEYDSATMVWLDACHDYESVKRDILTWLPKVRKGCGVIGGDDMGVPDEENPVWPGVRKAVREIFGDDWKYSPHDAWIHYKE